MDTKQQVGVGISTALTTAVCWGALPIAMKEVLTVMEPFTVVWYRFTMAAIGLGATLAVRGKLPPLTMFRQPRWLLLLAIATAGLLGNFVFFSSSLQYLSPTASQVIGQLSPVGMMFASVLILKNACVSPSHRRPDADRRVDAVFQRQSDRNLHPADGLHAGRYAGRVCGDGLGELRRGAEGIAATAGFAADHGYVVHFMCDSVVPLAKPEVIFQLSGWQLACLLFCGANTLIGYGALAEAMARWQAAQVSALVTLTRCLPCCFQIYWRWHGPVFAAPTLNVVGYVGAFVVVAGAMFSAIGHRWWPRRAEPHWLLL